MFHIYKHKLRAWTASVGEHGPRARTLSIGEHEPRARTLSIGEHEPRARTLSIGEHDLHARREATSAVTVAADSVSSVTVTLRCQDIIKLNSFGLCLTRCSDKMKIK